MNRSRLFLISLSALLLANPVWSEEIITIKSTITGSQEQPKVISIVPWQKPEDPDYFGKEDNSQSSMPDVFRPLDRKTFGIERDYLSVVRKSAQK